MVETSTSHGELLDGFPLLPLPGVDFAAHLVFFKDAPGGLFVAVDLPAAHALVIARPIAFTSLHILRLLALLLSTLMLLFPLSPQPSVLVYLTSLVVFLHLSVFL